MNATPLLPPPRLLSEVFPWETAAHQEMLLCRYLRAVKVRPAPEGYDGHSLHVVATATGAALCVDSRGPRGETARTRRALYVLPLTRGPLWKDAYRSALQDLRFRLSENPIESGRLRRQQIAHAARTASAALQ